MDLKKHEALILSISRAISNFKEAYSSVVGTSSMTSTRRASLSSVSQRKPANQDIWRLLSLPISAVPVFAATVTEVTFRERPVPLRLWSTTSLR